MDCHQRAHCAWPPAAGANPSVAGSVGESLMPLSSPACLPHPCLHFRPCLHPGINRAQVQSTCRLSLPPLLASLWRLVTTSNAQSIQQHSNSKNGQWSRAREAGSYVEGTAGRANQSGRAVQSG